MSKIELLDEFFPPEKRRKTPTECKVGARVTGSTLQLVITEEDSLGSQLWSMLTHLFVANLHVKENGKVSNSLRSEECFNSIATYRGYLAALKERHPNLKFVQCLNSLGHVENAKKIVTEYADVFFSSIKDLLEDPLFDYVELNFDQLLELPYNLCAKISEHLPTSKLIFTLNNRADFVERIASNGILKALSDRSEGVLFNSFGFLKYRITAGCVPFKTAADAKHPIFPCCECSLIDFMKIFEYVPDNEFDMRKFGMGIDTCGVLFHKEKNALSIVPLSTISHIKKFGETLPGGEIIHYYDYENMHYGMNSYLDNVEHERLISYDSQGMQNEKFDYVGKKGMGWVVIGDLKYDVLFLKDESLLKKAAKKFLQR